MRSVLFDRPEILLAVPAIWVLVVLLSGKPGLSRPRRIAAAAARGLALTLLIAAAAGPHRMGARSVPPESIVLADRSASVSPAGRAETAGILAGLAENGPARAAAFGDASGSDPRGAALAAAADPARRVVLVTDGHLSGDAAPLLADLGAAGRSVAAMGLASEGGERETAPPDPPRLVLPPALRAGEPVEITILSEGATEVEVRAGGASAAATDVLVRGPLPVLVLGLGPDAPLVRGLFAMGLDVRLSTSATAEALSGCRVAIAAGSFRLPADGGELLAFVRRGGGLLVATPEPIVYEGQAVADLLPAVPLEPEPEPAPPPPDPPSPESPPEDAGASPAEVEKEALTMTLVLVLDRSGSMLGEKMAVARAACVAAAEALDPKDRLGILAFNQEFTWVRRPAPAEDMRALVRAVSTIRPDGGTEIFAALEEAGRVIREEPSAIRHVILVSDGQDILSGFRRLVTELTGERITVSTIGIGTDHDARLLGSIASWGAGRFYDAIDPRELPRVVTLDTRRVIESERPPEPVRTPDVTAGSRAPEPPPEATAPPQPPPRRPVALRIAAPLPFLADLIFPPLPEVAPIRPRFPAQTALTTADGDPALCFWRFGEGRVALLPADIDGFSTWPDLPRFAAQIARFLAGGERPAEEPGIAAEIREGRLVVHSARAVARAEVQIGGREIPVALRRVGPATFAGDIPRAAGFEPIFARVETSDGTVVRAVGTAPPGPEDAVGTDAAEIARLAAATGRKPGAVPPPPEPSRVPGREPLHLPLVIAAVLLLPVDTALRRAS